MQLTNRPIGSEPPSVPVGSGYISVIDAVHIMSTAVARTSTGTIGNVALSRAEPLIDPSPPCIAITASYLKFRISCA